MALPKLNLSLETLRAMYRLPMWVAGLFINLEAVEKGLLNSRLIEYPFILEKLSGIPPGKISDIGCTDNANFVAPTLATWGWQVWGIDIREWRYTHPNFHFVAGDLSKKTDFTDGFFDYVLSISSIEHFGLTGRYGVKEKDPDADFKAVNEVRRVLKPGGRFLLTIPYGKGGIVRPATRIYDRERLQRLISGWTPVDERYWYLDRSGQWQQVSEEVAGQTPTVGGTCVALLELVNDQET